MTPEQQISFKLERLLAIKVQIKALDTEAKELQKMIFDFDNLPKLFIGDEGCLSLSTRENWAITDNAIVAELVSPRAFIDYATISRTGIVKAGGETAVALLKEMGALYLKSVSQYYTLRK